MKRIGEVEVDAAALWPEHAPRFTNERKRVLRMGASRWGTDAGVVIGP